MLRFMIAIAIMATSANSYSQSSASPAQIKFAEENKYDDTGPGAKTKEFAYRTYKTIDEALVAYLDDPDTKLPDEDRAKAIDLLYANNPYKSAGLYSHKPLNSVVTNDLQERPSFTSYDSRFKSPFRWEAPRRVYQSSDKPLYVYSFGIHPMRADSQSAQESRQDGVVHGYYTQVHDGKLHTVQYFDDHRRQQY